MENKPTYEELEQRIRELEDQNPGLKQLKAGLQTSTDPWQITFDAIGDAICLLGLDGKILQCNGAMRRLLDKPSREIINRYCWELMHDTTGPIENCPVARMKKTLQRETMVLAINNQWFDVVADPLLDQAGKLIGAVHIISDITEQRLLEEALKESEGFLQSVFDGLQDGISVLDRDLTIVKANSWMERIYSEHMPLIGQKCYKAYQNRESPCPWCPSIPAVETGKVHVEVVPYPSAEKPTGWIELSSFPRKDADGSVAGVIEHVKDISDKKIREAEKEMLQAQLQQAQKMEAIGTLAGGIAHDFNNILSAIIGHAEIGKMKVPEGSEVLANLDQVVRAGTRAAKLVKQILTLSRQHRQEQRPVQIKYILKEALKLLRATLPTTIK